MIIVFGQCLFPLHVLGCGGSCFSSVPLQSLLLGIPLVMGLALSFGLITGIPLGPFMIFLALTWFNLQLSLYLQKFQLLFGMIPWLGLLRPRFLPSFLPILTEPTKLSGFSLLTISTRFQQLGMLLELTVLLCIYITWFGFQSAYWEIILSLGWLIGYSRETKDELLEWGLITDAACLLCNHEVETVQHLFFSYPFSRTVWLLASKLCDILKPYPLWQT